jgi:hypothetical protein
MYKRNYTGVGIMRSGLHTSSEGTKYWFLNDKLHRTDGPAIEYATGDKLWYLNDQLHRTDGPAIEYADGDKVWYLNDQYYSFNQWLEANTELSDQQRVMFKLEWS